MINISKKNLIGLFFFALVFALVYEIIKGRAGVFVTKRKSEKTMDLETLWRTNSADEFTKEIYYEGESYRAQVKNIKGSDVALLSGGQVVIFDNDEQAWMQAGSYDLKIVQ